MAPDLETLASDASFRTKALWDDSPKIEEDTARGFYTASGPSSGSLKIRLDVVNNESQATEPTDVDWEHLSRIYDVVRGSERLAEVANQLSQSDDTQLLSRLRAVRNILVHQTQAIDVQELLAVAKQHLMRAVCVHGVY